MVGDCIECGFPIVVQQSGQIACPMCHTINQADIPGMGTALKFFLGAVAGIVVLVSMKRATRKYNKPAPKEKVWKHPDQPDWR